MFGTAFSNLRTPENQEPQMTRRRYSRRAQDQCVCKIDGQIYPVTDWSMGGAAINADTRPFGSDEPVELNFKFKTSDGVIDISQKAHIVRKTAQTVSFAFEPLTAKVRNALQGVIDDYVSARFSG